MKRIVVLIAVLSVLWPGTAQTFIRSLPTSTNLTGSTKIPVDDATFGTRAVTLQNLLASTATNATLLAAITNVVEDTATSLLSEVAVVFAENLQSLLSEASPSVAKLAYVLNDDSNGDATRGTYRYDPTLTGAETATVFMAQDKGGNTASTGRWVRMSAGDNYQMSVDTLDDALAVSPAYLAAGINPTNSIKLTVKTRARKTLGKGGAKTYYYSATAPATTNLGAVIHYGSGYLLWDKEGDITPQMFGALADGSNDDSTAIRAASLYAAGVGGRLYFPPGNYRLATNVFVHSNSDWSFDRNAWLVRDFGDLYQPYATVRNADFEYASTNAVTSVPANNTNIVIRGLKIRPASTNATGQGIALYGVRDVVIDGLTIQRTYGDWATAFFAENLKISNVEVLENSALFEDGIHVAGGKNITVQNGTVNAGDDMLAVGYDGADVFCEDVVFNNITGKSGSAYGIKIFAPAEQTAGTTFIQRIAYNNIVGEFGRNRNGGIYISEFGTPRGAITNVVINNVRGVVNQGGASHDGVQPFGIYQLGGSDITYRGVRMLGARQYPLYLNTPKGRVLFDDVQIDRPTALNDDSVIILQGGGAEIKFVNCEIAGSLTNAIWNQEANLRIINSKFTGSSTNVIEVKQATAASRVLEVRGTEFAGTSTKPVVSSGASNNLKRFEFSNNLVPTGSVFSGGPEFGDEVVIWGNTGLSEQSRMTGSDAAKTYIFGSGSTSETRFVVLAGDTGNASLVNYGASLQAQTVSTSTPMTLRLNPSGGAVETGAAIELGHASDTTIARSAAGVVTIEGLTVLDYSGTPTTGQIPVFTNGVWNVMTPGSSGIGGSTGSVDNRVLRADGTGGATLQNSAVIIDDYTSSTANNVAIKVDDGSTANIAAVITPKGTGAFILGPKPDGTAIGGNARGSRAVDLALERDSASRVASGAGAFAAGRSPTASGPDAVAIGLFPWSSGTASVAIGGQGATATGNYGVAIGGLSSGSSGEGAVALGGQSASASGRWSATVGQSATDKQGQFAASGGSFSTVGDSQIFLITARNSTASTTPTVLFLDGSSARITIPNNTTWTFTALLTGATASGAATYSYRFDGVIVNAAGTTSMPVAVTKTVIYESNAAADADATANNTNDSLDFTVTAANSTATRWSVSVTANQLSY